jgi:hypothetical protein
MSTRTANRPTRQDDTQGDYSSNSAREQTCTATFRSILFGDDAVTAAAVKAGPPEYFRDLNLDQIVDTITTERDQYDLKPFFYTPLTSVDAIRYRQAMFRDLETPALFDQIRSFAGTMRQMRSCIANSEKFYYNYQKSALFLSAVEIYCSAVVHLADDLSSAKVASRGLLDLSGYLTICAQSSGFRMLASEAERLRSDLTSVRYSLHVDGKRITVGRSGDEPDLSAEVLRTFEKFRQGASKEYQFRISSWPEINHVEAAILDRVARLYPEIFSRLAEFPERHGSFLNPVIARVG